MQKILRICLKTAVLFGLINLLFAATRPSLAHLSLYNHLYPGRPRLPYGENPQQSYNLTLNSLPAMFASHTLSQAKAADEYRVILLGDSNVWGWLLTNEQTLAAQLNQLGLQTAVGQQIVVYNLGYPILSLSKDLLLLDQAMAYHPDLIIWPVTLESFAPQKQLDHPILQQNPGPMRALISQYDLALDPNDPRFAQSNLGQQTIIGQRRALADWLRLQQVGVAWAATGIDQAIPDDIPLRQSDYTAVTSWQNYSQPTSLTRADLAFDVLAAGQKRAGNVPLLIINEPIFISSGQNSDLRYNLWYPRWAYDQYRQLLAAELDQRPYLDLWDLLPADQFTDSPVHLTPQGTAVLAQKISQTLTDLTP